MFGTHAMKDVTAQLPWKGYPKLFSSFHNTYTAVNEYTNSKRFICTRRPMSWLLHFSFNYICQSTIYCMSTSIAIVRQTYNTFSTFCLFIHSFIHLKPFVIVFNICWDDIVRWTIVELSYINTNDARKQCFLFFYVIKVKSNKMTKLLQQKWNVKWKRKCHCYKKKVARDSEKEDIKTTRQDNWKLWINLATNDKK